MTNKTDIKLTNEQITELHWIWDTETENGFEGSAITAQHCCVNQDGEIVVEANVDFVASGCVLKFLNRVYEVSDRTGCRKVSMYGHNHFYDLQRAIQEMEIAGMFNNNESYVRINTVSGQMVFGLIIFKGLEIALKDTFRMLMGSLAGLSASYLPPDQRKKSIDIRNFDIYDEKHLEYAIYDVTSLLGVLLAFSKAINVPFNKLSLTLAGQSFKLLKESYVSWVSSDENKHKASFKYGKINYVGLPKEINLRLFKYYHGGRVFIANGLSTKTLYTAVSFDITSSYPWQMYNYNYPLPGRKPLHYKRFINNKLPKNIIGNGRYLISIYVKNYKHWFPMLPMVIIHNAGTPAEMKEIKYPHGSFTTNITDKEYELFLEQSPDCEHTILSLEHWDNDKCDYWLKPYIDKYYGMKETGDELNAKDAVTWELNRDDENTQLREEWILNGSIGKCPVSECPRSGDAMRTTGKGMANTPYGKFAQKYAKHTHVFWGNETIDPDFNREEKDENNDHRNVSISAFITGSARVQLYKAILFYGEGGVIYSDTDSVKVTIEAYRKYGLMPDATQERGAKLGGWKHEGTYKDLVILAPKVYMGYHNDKHDGDFDKNQKGEFKLEITAKGLPLKGVTAILDKTFFVSDFEGEDYITQEKNQLNAIKEFIYKSTLDDKVVSVNYSAKPTKVKSYKKNNSFTYEPHKTITTPDKVNGYDFNESTNQYFVKTVNVELSEV